MYSEDELLSALKSCKDKYGKVKTTTLNNDSDFPSASVYYSRFGSLEAALKKADIKDQLQSGSGRQQKYSDEELLDILEKFESNIGPVSHKRMRQEVGYPEPSLYNIRFNSLKDACQTAGVEYEGYVIHQYDESDALEYLVEIQEKYGDTKSSTIDKDENGPSSYYYQRFGSLAEARKLAGLSKTSYSNKYTKDEALEELIECKEAMGDTKTKTVNAFVGCPSVSVYNRLFGNIQTARKEAGINPSWNPALEDLFSNKVPEFDDGDFHTYCLKIIYKGETYYYVGVSENIQQRLRTHGLGHENKVLPQKNKTIKFSDVDDITVEKIESHHVPDNRLLTEFALFKEKELAYDIAAEKQTNNIFGP